MAESRKVQILRILADASEGVKREVIAESIGVPLKGVDEALSRLKRDGLADNPERGLWLITDRGRDELAKQVASGEQPPGEPAKPLPEAGEPTIPSQADILREIGEELGIGRKKGEIPLSSIVNYVQRISNLDDLVSVWNALAEMDVAPNVRKRWMKLYAQTVPGKEFPEELKEKMETIEEAEKVKVTKEGEVAPKPKRYSIMEGKIVGDPEGDFTHPEAIKTLASERGASPGQADALAVQLAKSGPDTVNTIMASLGTLLPLIVKEPPKQDNTMVQILQQRIEQLADEKHKAEMDSLRTEMRTGQRPPGPDPQMQALTQQINDMREALHNEQLARIQEQNEAITRQLLSRLERLDEQVRVAQEGKTVDSKMGLMSTVVDKGFGELRGLRDDIKPLVENVVSGGRERLPRKRTPEEVAGFSRGIDKGIEHERKLREMEDRLFLGKSPKYIPEAKPAPPRTFE